MMIPLDCKPFLRECASPVACAVLALSLQTSLVAPLRAGVLTVGEGADLIGTLQTTRTRYEDTLTDVARLYNLGYEEIVLANPSVDPWLPGEGTQVLLPTSFVLPDAPRSEVVVNIAEFRLYYYFRDSGRDLVATFPISIGRMDWATPLGLTEIVSKVKRPSWYPPASVREEYAADGRTLPPVVPPGPENPLGDYALRLGLPGYLIHGTNRPAGVGMRVTHGCIRLYPEDIGWLFPQVKVNARVRLVNQPFKMGWVGDDLYLEAHPPLASEDEEEGSSIPSMTMITEQYVRVTGNAAVDADWDLIMETLREQTGAPVKVGRRTGQRQQLIGRSVVID